MYFTLVTVHVLAAIVWVGGVLFLALVGAPVLRRVEPPALQEELFNALGMRFRHVGWSAVAVLLVTGTWLLWSRGWLSTEVAGRAAFWRSPAGSALAWKLGAVIVMIGLNAVHDASLSPERVREMRQSPAWPATRRRMAVIARAGAVAALAVVMAAIRLARS